jgi:hypothetical protein
VTPECQIVPEDAVPKEYRAIGLLPDGKTQIIDRRYVCRYWKGINFVLVSTQKVDEIGKGIQIRIMNALLEDDYKIVFD